MTFNPRDLKLWHEVLMDEMILSPRISREELAEKFQTSVQYITNLTTSDLFQHKLAERRERMGRVVEDTALARLTGKTARLAEVAIDKLTDTIVRPGSDITLEGVRDTAEMALKSLGFGQTTSRPGPAVVNQTVVVIDRETLASARARMRGERVDVIEHAPALPAA